MLPSEYEELVFKAAVIRDVGGRLGIKETVVLAASELLPQIQRQNSEAAAALNDFLAAHQAWSDFHVNVERTKRTGLLTISEHAELDQLIENRDRTRGVLLTTLEEAVRD